MYDTINMRLYSDECGGVDFIRELPRYLTTAKVNADTATGELWMDGSTGNLRVTANRYSMQVRDGSLCKWALGDNYHILGKTDTQRAIERLSDELHLPMRLAFITRLDVAANMIMKYPPEVYLHHLGDLRYTKRIAEPSGLYYTQAGKSYRLSFYDKTRESIDKCEDVPEPYRGHNVMRYEQRYLKRIAKRLNRPELRAAALYEGDLHNELVKRWCGAYEQINKINQNTIKLKMSGKKQFYKLGTLALMEKVGGANALLAAIDEQRKMGEINSKAAYDLRAAVRDACKIDGEYVTESEAVTELTDKIRDVANLYG